MDARVPRDGLAHAVGGLSKRVAAAVGRHGLALRALAVLIQAVLSAVRRDSGAHGSGAASDVAPTVAARAGPCGAGFAADSSAAKATASAVIAASSTPWSRADCSMVSPAAAAGAHLREFEYGARQGLRGLLWGLLFGHG